MGKGKGKGRLLTAMVVKATLLERMDPRGSVVEVARAWTRNSNALQRGVAKAIPEQSICKISHFCVYLVQTLTRS